VDAGGAESEVHEPEASREASGRERVVATGAAGREMSGNTTIEVGTILSHRTKEGMVELTLNGEKTQMDLAKAREVRGMLDGAIEAAVSDTLIYKFLTTKVGLSEDASAAALLDFRELRQGSRSTVYPQ
jgi:hypothetical protein